MVQTKQMTPVVP